MLLFILFLMDYASKHSRKRMTHLLHRTRVYVRRYPSDTLICLRRVPSPRGLTKRGRTSCYLLLARTVSGGSLPLDSSSLVRVTIDCCSGGNSTRYGTGTLFCGNEIFRRRKGLRNTALLCGGTRSVVPSLASCCLMKLVCDCLKRLGESRRRCGGTLFCCRGTLPYCQAVRGPALATSKLRSVTGVSICLKRARQTSSLFDRILSCIPSVSTA